MARAHYLQVRDTDFDKALEKVVHHAVRAMATDHAHVRHGDHDKSPVDASKRQITLSNAKTKACPMPVTGLEPVPHCWDRHLKTARLPISPHGLRSGEYGIGYGG